MLRGIASHKREGMVPAVCCTPARALGSHEHKWFWALANPREMLKGRRFRRATKETTEGQEGLVENNKRSG